MKRALIFLLLFLMVMAAMSQPKTRGKVKRKYRDVEKVGVDLPQVIFRGLVRDAEKNPIPGACVEIEGIKRLVHSNELGKFVLTGLPTDRMRIKVSCLGYRTKTSDFVLRAGFNDYYIALDQDIPHVETLISGAQKREQHIQDVPSAVSVITQPFSDQLAVTGFTGIAEVNRGFWYEETGAGKAGFSIRGSALSFGTSGVPQSVAVISNEVPVMQPAGVSSLLFDVERVEVLNGPQNSLFGRDAIGGAVHVVSKKPDDRTGGYLSAGGGNLGAKEARAAVNVPLVQDMLFARAAGMYSSTGGYVRNTPGAMLNGENTMGGRLSFRFLPVFDHLVDLSLNYTKKERTGMAFLNPWIKNETAPHDINTYRAYLNRGDTLGSEQELLDATLTYRYFLDEHDYWTVISSYRKSRASDSWDADGTALPALEMDDETSAKHIYQEIRYNFSNMSRLNGSAGLSYSSEKENYRQGTASNDRLIFDILSAPGRFVMPAGNRFPVNPQPLNPDPMAGYPLSGDHSEERINERRTRSAQAYIHFTYRVRQTLFFTGGIRGLYDRVAFSQESLFTGGAASQLGKFTNSAPNLVYAPTALQEVTNNSLSVTGQAGFTYRRNENFSFYINAVRGRKPEALLFTWDSKPLITSAELVNSAEAGWKAIYKARLYWDVTGFYRRHLNVQTINWRGAHGSGMVDANGKATSFGAETHLKAAVVKGVELFGNYAWMQSKYDSTGVDGSGYVYAGNRFARAPEHSFSAGVTLKTTVVKGMQLFATPWYSWQSHLWFTEANTPGLDQPAFGLLNINAGVELEKPKVALSVFGSNLLDERYNSGAGHWGGLFGMPTTVPGAPRMLGAKISWSY
jgi:iron complex outermembrane recepter protein